MQRSARRFRVDEKSLLAFYAMWCHVCLTYYMDIQGRLVKTHNLALGSTLLPANSIVFTPLWSNMCIQWHQPSLLRNVEWGLIYLPLLDKVTPEIEEPGQTHMKEHKTREGDLSGHRFQNSLLIVANSWEKAFAFSASYDLITGT